MSVRSTVDTIWMHRNCTHIVHRFFPYRSNVRTTINTIPLCQARPGLSGSGFNQLVSKAASSKRTTRTYDPYDALRREEEVLREQDSKRRSVLSQSEVRSGSGETSENKFFDQTASPPSLDNDGHASVRELKPIVTMQSLHDEYDNFEPISKARRQSERPQMFRNQEKMPIGSAVLQPTDESPIHKVNEQNIFPYHANLVEDSLDIKYTSQYQPHTPLEIAFFESKDRVFKSLLAAQDLASLRQTYKDEYTTATKSLQHSEPAHLSDLINAWKASGDFQPIAQLLTGSCLTSASEALRVYSALGSTIDAFNIRVTFLHLAYALHRKDFEQNPRLADQLDGRIDDLRNPTSWPEMPIKLDFTLLLMNRLNDSQLHELMSDIDLKYYDPGPYQCQFYTRLCLGKGWTETAFKMLKKLKKDVLQKPHKGLVILTMRLIKRDSVIDGPGGPNFRFLSELLRKGLVLNAAMHSCITERALELNYPNVAWDLYHHLKAGGHDIESRTYLLLLQHSFSTRNEQAVNEIMSEMHAKKALFTDPALLSCAMNIIRNVCFFYQKMEAPECLSHLLALYDRAYTRAPLIRLGIVTDLGPRESVEELPEPDTYMLCFMLWAYILCHRHVPSAMKVWDRIHQRIQKGDIAIVECMTMDFLYNAYILLYRRSAKTLPHALEMFQYMLEKRWCLPSERTWAIIILGFLQHEQQVEARQLMELMYAHGFTNQTFNPSHFPRGVTVESIAALANTKHDEFLMPDGSDPLQNELVSDEKTHYKTLSKAYKVVERGSGQASKDELPERDLDISMPFARLVTT